MTKIKPPQDTDRQRSHAYRQLWRVVDGAVNDAFNNHPDYAGQFGPRRLKTIRNSVTKRVVGSVLGYAEQSAQGRSGDSPAASSGQAFPKAWFIRGMVRLPRLKVLSRTFKGWATLMSTPFRRRR